MKKYPILVGLIGLLGISIVRITSLSFAASSTDFLAKAAESAKRASAKATAVPQLSVDEMREKVEANPLLYNLVLSRINQLFSDYDKLLKQYKAATSPNGRAEITKKMDTIRKELNKWIS